MSTDRLADELRALSRTLDVPAPDDDAVAEAVLARVDELDRPRRRVGWRRTLPRHRWRAALAAFAGLLLVLALTPAVRAAVADWFGFGGVVVRPGPAVSSAPPPPRATGGLTLEQGERLVGFTAVVPAPLGRPDGVEVSADRRVLSLTWHGPGDGDTIRVDEFDGQVSPVFVKTAKNAEWLSLGPDATGWWFPEPHQLRFIDRDGIERVETTRPAGPTLVWLAGGVTLRLEGLAKQPAVDVALTTDPTPFG